MYHSPAPRPGWAVPLFDRPSSRLASSWPVVAAPGRLVNRLSNSKSPPSAGTPFGPSEIVLPSSTAIRRKSPPNLKLWLPRRCVTAALIDAGLFHLIGAPPHPPTFST